jgi:hypothetical protein
VRVVFVAACLIVFVCVRARIFCLAPPFDNTPPLQSTHPKQPKPSNKKNKKQVVSGLGLTWQPAFGIILAVYFYSHYFFASGAAHIGAMYTAFLAVAQVGGGVLVVFRCVFSVSLLFERFCLCVSEGSGAHTHETTSTHTKKLTQT